MALYIPEILSMVIEHVDTAPDLLNCACVNSVWSDLALKKLYRGSLHDMQFCTPDIGSLNSLFAASRKRFTRNMSYVRHLLLCSNNPVSIEPGYDKSRSCIEACRPLKNSENAKVFERLQGGGPASLIIPFQIVNQPVSVMFDTLLTSAVEFLAINSHYCSAATFAPVFQPFPPQRKSQTLKALTIYTPSVNKDIDDLCRMLRYCDLEFFRFEELKEGRPYGDFKPDEAHKLFLHLQKQKNLKAFSIYAAHDILPSHLVTGRRTNEKLWPKLKALSFSITEQDWMKQCPSFEDLRILNLGFAIGEPLCGKYLAMCGNLQAIDISIHELGPLDALLNIANACPLLRKFHVGVRMMATARKMPKTMFLGIVRALPRLEVLNLEMPIQMDVSMVKDIARYCPQLTMLFLRMAALHLSLARLIKLPPLRQLEAMEWKRVLFENPQRLLGDRHRAGKIAAEWQRVFPKLRAIPCPIAYCRNYIKYIAIDSYEETSMHEDDVIEDLEGDYSSSESGEDDANEVGVLGKAPIWYDARDTDPEWLEAGFKVWKKLGYTRNSSLIHSIANAWQANLEISTIGWPVMSSDMFTGSPYYSSTAKLAYYKP